MTDTQVTSSHGARPFVAVVCRVPMVGEALRDTLSAFATVEFFPAHDGTEGLLRSVRPDAVVVDSDEEAAAVAPIADELGLAVVHVSLKDEQVRVLEDGRWRPVHAATPEAVRDAVAGLLFGRARG
jgi:hypothetical protein